MRHPFCTAPLTGEQIEQARDLAARAARGERRAIARAISLIEDGDPRAAEVVRLLYPRTGHARLIGLTGPPGVGKSTLLSGLIRVCRGRDLSVGVVSVDPSSPFTHGAVLGDRIRLNEHFLDPEVFIRSMGTRGHLGGLSETALQAALVLDAAGKDMVFLETVGVGQSEVEVASIADTVVLALMPGSGDSIQALKAGVMEIPDIIVVNKKDHPAADITLNEIRGVLALAERERDWDPPLLATNATTGEGVAELWERIAEHQHHLTDRGLLDQRRSRSLEKEVFALTVNELERWLVRRSGSDPRLDAILQDVRERRLDPLSAVRAVLVDVLGVAEECP
ncbi:MAG: methylmalonyl Co-A mutase-associated GTPase MeaB [Thermoleophilia bacterium]